MIPDHFSVEPASWKVDLAALREVRERVFLVEQQIPPDEEWDAFDEKSHHVLARDREGRPIGTGRLVPPQAAIEEERSRDQGKDAPGLAEAAADIDPTHPVGNGRDGRPSTSATIGRIAVIDAWRGKGVGEAIMRVLLEQARGLRYAAVELHAQSHAVPFYARLGFAAYGDEFEECGIAHRTMHLELGPGNERDPSPLAPKPQPRILAADDREQALAATAALLADAKYEVAIYTRDLDAALFDMPATLDALKRIALSGRRAQIRIIVHDARKPLAEGHRLIALAQRLSSTIAVRTPVDERDLQYPSAFLLNDRAGYFLRMLGSRLEGEGSTYAPGRHAQLRELFDQVWERSAPSEELRPLGF